MVGISSVNDCLLTQAFAAPALYGGGLGVAQVNEWYYCDHTMYVECECCYIITWSPAKLFEADHTLVQVAKVVLFQATLGSILRTGAFY